MPAYEIAVRGLVQGVNYRNFTRQAASALAVHGWVRNEPDGSVRVLLQHPDATLLHELIRQLAIGPPAAQVEGLEITVLEAEPELTGFEIRR